jgi:hypothetical protein
MPVLKSEIGTELSALWGAVDQLGDNLEQAGLGRLGGGAGKRMRPGLSLRSGNA